MGAIIILYGFLTNYVIMSASRNRKAAIPNPPILDHVGQGLFGLTVGILIMLLASLATGFEIPVDSI